MTFYFCYEKQPSGGWAPVVYHGEAPKTEKVSGDDKTRRSTVWPVPPDCLGSTDGQPLWGRLQAKFPAPKDEI